MADAAGNHYGTTPYGGAYSHGSVFVIPHGTSEIHTLASFDGTNGDQPSGLTFDSGGNLYGTTFRGGAINDGTVFEIPAGTDSIETVASFDWGNGSYPLTGVVFDADGNLYGSTASGGDNSQGTVFEIAYGTNTIQTVASLASAGATRPERVTLDAHGNLFGTTSSGGAYGQGIVFEIPHATKALLTLASFNIDNGAMPFGGVTPDAEGNLYGTTSHGGANERGTVFKIPANSSSIQTLASLNSATGTTPQAGVTLDSEGNIFGTAVFEGQYGFGTVFEIPRASGQIQTLLSFSGSDGANPGELTLDRAGNLFGTTSKGGPTDDGTVFKLAKSASTVPPFLGRPFNIPGDTIYANQFDNGGEGVAYHDTTPQNIGGQYRPAEGVDINIGGANGSSVGYAAPGEWLNYSISAPADGAYVLQARVANFKQGGTFHVEIDGKNVTGTMTVPDTGPWDTWQTITSQSFSVSKGDHVMRVVMDNGGYWGNVGDFDSFKFVARRPFHVKPFNIATDTIEAEDFDLGFEGIAYHDTTFANIPGKYRSGSTDVGAVANASNGFAVGYTDPGEWLNYTINAPVQGTYSLQSRVANYLQGGTFHVEIDGTNVTGTMTVPNTGPWDTWQTLTSQPFTVAAGTHQMRLVMDTGGYWHNVGDFDSFKFVSGVGPFKGTPFNINTDTIEAEDFNNGGEGIAYHDTTPGNQTGLYRPAEGVDINKGGSNGYSVGYTAPGEWLGYSINAPSSGAYVLQATVADLKPGGTFHVEIDGQNVTGTMSVPDTGAWFNWQTITSAVFDVSPGDHTMRVVLDSGGYWGNVGNFDSFKFVSKPYVGHPYVVGLETIEAENFDNGGEGIAFHDTTPQNLGGKYRTTAVDINAGGSNGFDIGYTAPGEWVAYSVNSPTGGGFVLQAGVASLKPGGEFHVEIDGQNVTGVMTVPDTSGWFAFQTVVSQKFTVSPGNHLMRVVMDAAGELGAVGNFDYFRFAPAGVVTLVSQERSVTTISPGRTPMEQTINADPGNFGAFEQKVDVVLDTGLQFTCSQSSNLTVSGSGAEFLVSGLAAAHSPYHLAGGETKFKIDFDVTSPVPYLILFSQGHDLDYGDAIATLDTPSGRMWVTGPEYPPAYYRGTLEAGRYTLATGAGGGQGFELEMYLGSKIPWVKPPWETQPPQ